MGDFEQKTVEYGTTILKLIRVKEQVGGQTRTFSNILISAKHLREQDNEMTVVRIIPLAGVSKHSGANINTAMAAEKLSINKLSASVNHRSETIDFGPVQGVSIEEVLRSKGIGSFAMNELVRWLKSNFPEYTVNPFEFIVEDSISSADKDRRNKFLENFGFSLNFTDMTSKSGTMKVKKAGSMREYTNYDKIEEHEIEPFVLGLITEKAKLEKDLNELKNDYALRGEELLGGIPKPEIIKYTIIAAVLILVIFIALMI